MRVTHTQPLQHRVGFGSGTELAILRGVLGILDELPAYGVDIGVQVFGTGFSRRGVYGQNFNGIANHIGIAEAGGKHAFDEVFERGHVVHEDPEAR